MLIPILPRRKVLLGGAVLILILLLGLLQALQFREERLLRERVEQSYSLGAELARFLSLNQDIETGQRGYVLTGNPQFLQPYLDARGTAEESLARLHEYFAGNPAAMEELRQLDRLIQQKLEFSEEVIALRRQDADAAAARIGSGEGRLIMDQMRAVIRDLEASESQTLVALQYAAAESRVERRIFGATIQLLLLALLVWAFLAYLRKMRSLQAVSAAARDQSVRLTAIFEAATDAILVVDAEGNIETANPSAERLLRADRQQLTARSLEDMFISGTGDSPVQTMLDRMAAQLDSPYSSVQALAGRRADGSTFEAEIAISPVKLAEELRYLLVIRDVTERRRVERMKTEFVSTVSHELRTPLTSIAGSLGLIAGGAAGEIGPRAKKLVDIAHNNSRRLVRLINDILDIEKIESGKMTFDLRPLDLREVAHEAVQANHGFAAEAGVEIVLASVNEPVVVRADHDRLIQVLTNLLSNAIKFSPFAAAVRMEITRGTEMHRITVSDCGPGIASEFQERLFEKFAQADSSDTRSKGGTGLGLAIVKEIVQRIGGSITFETSPQGTAFNVELPAAAGMRDRCVLLVHVDERLSQAIEQSLKTRGIDAVVVRDLQELNAACGRHAYAAILLGLDMQGEDASSLVRLIRSRPELAGTPILAAAPGEEPGQVSQAVALVDWLDRAPSAADLKKGTEMLLNHDSGRNSIRVLHVEDDEDVLGVVASAFEGRAAVVSARSTAEARKALAAAHPDLVILDLALPDESGLSLLPMLRDSNDNPIPVVIYTASDEDSRISCRVAAMLTKSKADLDDLVSTVLTIVEQQGARA